MTSQTDNLREQVGDFLRGNNNARPAAIAESIGVDMGLVVQIIKEQCIPDASTIPDRHGAQARLTAQADKGNPYGPMRGAAKVSL